MKLKVNLRTGEVTRVEGEFKALPGIRNNSQHFQLDGHVLVGIGLTAGEGHFNLLHPDTEASSGHVDVSVRYEDTAPLTFHYYSGYEQFVPASHHARQLDVWPSGPLSLIRTVLAIEEFLESEVGFRPTFREQILNSLHKESLALA